MTYRRRTSEKRGSVEIGERIPRAVKRAVLDFRKELHAELSHDSCLHKQRDSIVIAIRRAGVIPMIDAPYQRSDYRTLIRQVIIPK
jgi:hypothetical protein